MIVKPNKPNRNDPCYCNSGKKYKKCCINKEEPAGFFADSDFRLSFSGIETKDLLWVRKYDAKKLLAIISILQLQEENHGKNVRLEHVVTEIIKNNIRLEKMIDYSILRKDLLSCQKHPDEDPPEDFFTDNILFSNGNNITYPGIFIHATSIVQSQLDALNRLRNQHVLKIQPILEGVYFMLHLHNELALLMGHKRKMFKVSQTDKLYLPANNELDKLSSNFVFTKEDLELMCLKIHVQRATFLEFVYNGSLEKVSFKNLDEHPLFYTPLVSFDEDYVLAMPTAQLAAINHFIIRKVIAGDILREFVLAFSRGAKLEVETIFFRMGWNKIAHIKTETEMQKDGTILQQSVFQFDVDKLALVNTFVYPPDVIIDRMEEQIEGNTKSWEKINQKGKELKKDYPDASTFLIAISNRTNIFGTRILQFPDQKIFDQSIGMSINELRVLPVKWEFDALTLWKYARDRHCSEGDIQFMPYNTHLAIYKFYEDNFQSFYHPDHQAYNFAFIEFDVEGDINRESKWRTDKIGVLFLSEQGMIWMSCIKKEKHLPIYISNEYKYGILRQCLVQYNCPIWVQSDNIGHPGSEVYVNAILYWLNTCCENLKDFFSQFGDLPIIIHVRVDEKIYDKNRWDLESPPQALNLDYSIIPKKRSLEITIPINIISHFSQADNGGELLLMSLVIDCLGEMAQELSIGFKLDPVSLKMLLKASVSQEIQKMILIAQVPYINPSIAGIDVDKPRYMANSDISNVLQQQINSLEFRKKIHKNVSDMVGKGEILNDLVAIHFKKVVAMIAEFEAIPFLVFLMQRHEDLLYTREIRKIRLPTIEACYGKYYDVFEEFGKLEADIVSTSLALRTLIEFVACEMPSGKKVGNHESVDIILAHIIQLINYGALSDSIKYEIENPRIGLLPSGRIGIDYGNSNKWLSSFRNDLYREELDKYKTDFHKFFKRKNDTKESKDGDVPYYDRVDKIFIKEWGITLWNIIGMSTFLCWKLFEMKKSVAIMSENEIVKICMDNFGREKEEITAFLKILTFVERKGILNLDKNKLHEAYPWRYNRTISYMLRPLIRVTIKGEPHFILSARHLFVSSENIFARFMDGTLKVQTECKGIQKLLAERNDIKGTKFRNSVFSWLKENTTLDVFNFEVKIKPKGYFNAETDKGDIDILCIDHNEKIIYSIECKNTSQAKIAYDIYIEMRNYLGMEGKPGMVDKHFKRHKWLVENIEQVKEILKIVGKYRIKSIILTRNIVPTRYLRKVALPVFSYSDLLAKKIFK